MDQHIHNRTNCPTCLKVPAWQFGLFIDEDDFCDEHKHEARYYSELMRGPNRFDEYHDGLEVRELAEVWRAYDGRLADEERYRWNEFYREFVDETNHRLRPGWTSELLYPYDEPDPSWD
jgi:hypothetical protein